MRDAEPHHGRLAAGEGVEVGVRGGETREDRVRMRHVGRPEASARLFGIMSP